MNEALEALIWVAVAVGVVWIVAAVVSFAIIGYMWWKNKDNFDL